MNEVTQKILELENHIIRLETELNIEKQKIDELTVTIEVLKTKSNS